MTENNYMDHIERLVREGGLDTAEVIAMNKLFYEFITTEHMIGLAWGGIMAFGLGVVVFLFIKYG